MPQIAGFRGALAGAARDATRAVYRYHQVFKLGGRSIVRKQMIAAVKLAPYAEGSVRPHLETTAAAREAEHAAIHATKTQTKLILAGFRDAPLEVERQMRKVEEVGAPTHETTTPDGTIHRLWRASNAELIGTFRHMFAPKKLHLLDGHARYEALLAHADELGAKTPLAQYSSAAYAMMALVNLDAPELFVAPRHRLVRGIGRPAAEVLAAARPAFIVEKVPRDPVKLVAALADSVAHQPAFVIAFKGEADAWKLTLAPDVSLAQEGVQVHRALQRLDPVVLYKFFVPRALPDAKLEPVSDLLVALASDAEAVLVTRAVALAEALHADELGQLLPDGATAFAPALADLVTFSIDPDEDLV